MNKIEFNTQTCTTIEQSKRLLELGLKPETSDMLILPLPNVKELITQRFADESENLYYKIKGEQWESFPAWSLHRLLKIGNITGDGFLEIDNIYEVCIRLIGPKIKFKLINPEYINS